jgi:hypothetical protein
MENGHITFSKRHVRISLTVGLLALTFASFQNFRFISPDPSNVASAKHEPVYCLSHPKLGQDCTYKALEVCVADLKFRPSGASCAPKDAAHSLISSSN